MRLHFTIRDLLWLTARVAMATGWWLEHRKGQKQATEYLTRINAERASAEEREAKLKDELSDARGTVFDLLKLPRHQP